MKRSDLPTLPDAPGVYQWHDASGTILYIGRATSLRDRVRSYFTAAIIAERGPHIVDMVTTAHHVTFIETPTVFDAILLESELIRRYKPYYNTKEKDDRSRACIVITKEQIPRIFAERQRILDSSRQLYRGATIFGPFPSMKIAQDILRFLRRIFPFFDKKSSSQYHNRFYDQLGLIPGQADSLFIRRYRSNIRTIARILRGDRTAIVTELTDQMNRAAEKTDFELAARLRDTIRGLSAIPDTQFITGVRATIPYERIEAYDTSHFGGSNHVGVMAVLENGEPLKSEYRSFIIRSAGAGDDIAATVEMLQRRLKHTEWPLPHMVVIDGGSAHLAAALRIISPTITVVSVVKNEKHAPREILGIIPDQALRTVITIANSEAHRFAKRIMSERMKTQRLGGGARKRRA